MTSLNNSQTHQTGSSSCDTKYLPLTIQGEELIQDVTTSAVSPTEVDNEKRFMNVPKGVKTNDLQDIFCIPGHSNLQPLRSSSVSPSIGIDSGSALSSNVSTESGSSRQQHKQYNQHSIITRPMDLRTRRLSSAHLEYVRYTLKDLEVGTKYRYVKKLFF